MSLKDAFFSELGHKRAAAQAQRAPFEHAYGELQGFYRSIVGDSELMDAMHAEVELNEDELTIDPGPILITIKVASDGACRMFYEVKRADDYSTTDVPEATSIADIEKAVAKLLVQHRPADDDE